MQKSTWAGLMRGALAVSIVAAGASAAAQTQGEGFFARPQGEEATGEASRAPHPAGGTRCQGKITQVSDVGFEGVRTTAYNWSVVGGGGEGARYDPVPVLSTKVNLVERGCLNAHLSAIVGSRQTYGPGIASIAMFQVTLTPANGGPPQHMFGHYETPYGIYAPAVAVEAERDVDMLGANFFQRVGDGPGEVPPGSYRVDVWWAGGPVGGGGAIGAGFVLKLYLY